MDECEFTVFGVDPLTDALCEFPTDTLDEAIEAFKVMDRPDFAARIWSREKQGFLLQAFVRSYVQLKQEKKS